MKDIWSFLGFKAIIGVLSKVCKDSQTFKDMLVGHQSGVSIQIKEKEKISIPLTWGPAQQTAFDHSHYF